MGVLNLDLSDENKDFITEGIIKGTIELMKSTVKSQTLQKRSKRFTKPRFQSKNAIAKDTIQYNILSGTQILPARPRDFRKSLDEEERNIDKHELSDIFSTPILKNLITRKKEKYPFKRGKPNSDLDEERRGAYSYFEKTEFLQIIEIILRDSERLKKIDDIVTNDKIYEDFSKYSYVLKKKVKEENEIAFRNVYKPIKHREENHKNQISLNNITFERKELILLYKLGAMMFFNSLILSQSD